MISSVLAFLLVGGLQEAPSVDVPPPDEALIAAAEAGDPQARFDLAFHRYTVWIGDGRSQEESLNDPYYQSLVTEFEALAEAELPAALSMMSTIYQVGMGRPADPERAREYRERAHELGDPGASLGLAIDLYQSSDPLDVVRAVDIFVALTREHLGNEETSAIGGFAAGFVGLAMSTGAGGRDTDYESGFDMLKVGLTVDPEHTDFNYMIGRYYETGTATPQDPQAALRHYVVAAENGHGRAAWMAGMQYLNGVGTIADEREAFRLVNLSAEAGDTRGMVSAAVMHAIGQGTEQRGDIARHWYRQAAERGNAHAMRGLGAMLMTGEGGHVDEIFGYALLELAEQAGDTHAARLLGQFGKPSKPNWEAEVAAARAQFLEDSGLDPDRLHDAQLE